MPDDGSQALLIDGGGIDGGNGFTIASHGDDLRAIGSIRCSPATSAAS
jgi:hypothetical protein